MQKTLEDFQSYMIRGILSVPKSCPIPSLSYESNSLQMKYRVFSKILNFTKHILCQDENTSLAKQIISEQISNEWDGLYKDTEKISDYFNVSGLSNPLITQ